MPINTIPHGTEEYYCTNCEISKTRIEVKEDWKCPKCNNPVHVRVKTEVKDNACFRIKIKELEIDDMILINREDEFRRVLNLKEEKDNIRVAIKNYTTITVDKNSHILKLDGRWYH